MSRAETLGLPANIRACLFDLDGVLTETAKLHARAWKELFDEYLEARARRTGAPFEPFDPVRDFERYVDGKRRSDGTRSFLAARGIELPEGTAADPPSAETIHGLSARKDALFNVRLQEGGVHAFPGSVRYARAARDAGKRTAVVSSTFRVLVAANSPGL